LKQVKNRYSRNIKALTIEEFEELQKKAVCIVGIGGLGGTIAELLSRTGVRKITVIDGDSFEESNLNRQIYSREDNLGQNKAEAARIRIEKTNSEVEITVHTEYINRENGHEIIKGSDVVVDALDSIETRFLLKDIAKDLGIPLVHGSIGGWYGQVSTIFPEDDTLETIYKNENRQGIEKKLGNLGSTASLVASVQAAEVIKILTGKGELLRNSVLRIDTLYNEYDLIKLS
jgi:molybdopterin-synthase adenylyltransferase